MFRLTLEQGHSVATLFLVAVAALGLAGLFYRRCFGHLPASRWRVLFALRAVAILLVVLLLFRPVFSLERELVQRRSVIFLLDTSTSMATTDDESGKSRFEQARGRIIGWLGKLAKDFDVRLVEFAESAAPLAKPGDVANLKPTGEATSITRGLVAASKQVEPRDVEAVILFSDGIHNAIGDPVTAAQALGLVVHTVGVGNSLKDSPSYRDVQVAGIEIADQLPVNNKAQITARVRQVGLAGRVVPVQLLEDDKQVDQSELELKDAEAPQEVVFQYVPTVKGRHTYTIRIPAVPDEKIAENNHRAAIVQVIDSHIKVLYVEGTLRAEYGAIVQRFLSKDPDIEFCSLVQTRPNVFLQRTNMKDMKLSAIPNDAETFARFDVFVLGDIDSTYWKPPQMALLAQRVKDGAGLLMIGGYHSLGPGGYGGSALEDVLPALLGSRDIGQITDPFLPVLTPDGRAHPIFANISKFFPTAAGAAATGRPAAAGRVRQDQRRQAGCDRAGHLSDRGHRHAHAHPGRAAGQQGTLGRLHRRHHPQLAAGPPGVEPGIAVLAVLGPDHPLAGQPRRGHQDRGRRHRAHRQGVLRARLAHHRAGRRPRQGGRGHRPGRRSPPA